MFELSDKELIEWVKFVVESLYKNRSATSSNVKNWNECVDVFRQLINFFTSKLINQIQTLKLPLLPVDKESFYAHEIEEAEAEFIKVNGDSYCVYSLIDVIRACKLITTDIELQKLMISHIRKNRYQPQEMYQSSTYKFIVGEVCPKLVLPDHMKLTPPALVAVCAAADYLFAELIEPVWNRTSIFTHLRNFVLFDKALVAVFDGCKLKHRSSDLTFLWSHYNTL